MAQVTSLSLIATPGQVHSFAVEQDAFFVEAMMTITDLAEAVDTIGAET